MHTPITAFYAGLLAVTFFYLTILVVKQRRAKKISLGDGGDAHLSAYMRAHGNFSEYVPISLILIFIAEVNQTSSIFLHALGSALLIGRLIHAYGLTNHSGASWQRIVGMLLTFFVLLGGAGVNLWQFTK